MSEVILIAQGVVTVVAEHATHPGYRSIHWRRTDNYSKPGMEPAPMWVPEHCAPRVGETIRVTVELSRSGTTEEAIDQAIAKGEAY